MAQRVRDEKLALEIVVNGDPARKQIADMNRQIKDLTIATNDLKSEQRAMVATGQKNSERYKELSKQIAANEAAIKSNKAEVNKMQSALGLNCMTMDELSKKARSLQISLRHAVPGTEEWKEYAKQLKEVLARQTELKAASTNTGGVLDGIAGKANTYFGAMAMGVQVFDRISNELDDVRKDYLEYDEALTSASRTTNLTKEEVEALSDELRKMDTRTSQNELIALVEVAGKLGISGENDILGFVSAADKINVALSKDLGGNAEDALKSIGKLVDIFKLKEDYGIEQSMLKVGSTINSLGMASTANEGYIVDFAQQMAGIAPTANMSIQQVLGLAATLDSLGQRSETATTALTNAIGDMFKKTELYANVAGVGLQDFEQLLTTDVNEALLLVLEGVGKGSTADTVKALDSLGLSGSRATTILGSLSQNTEVIRYQQELANQAFADGTSAIEEFDRMNNSATASMEKAKKAILEQKVAIGEQLNPAATQMMSASAQSLKIISSLIGLAIKYRAAIAGVTAAYAANVALNKIKALWLEKEISLSKLRLFWSKANRQELAKETANLAGATSGTIALCAAKNLLVLNLKSAAVAFKAFWVSIGPIGWAAAAIGALVGVISAVRNKSEEMVDLSKEIAGVTNQEGESLVGKAEKMRRLMSVIEDTNAAEETRNAALKELQGLMPDGINLINQETLANGKAAEAVKKHTQALIEEATLKAALKKKQEILDKVGEDKLSGEDRKVGFWKKMMIGYAAAASEGMLDYNEMMLAAQDQAAKDYEEKTKKQLDGIDAVIEKSRKATRELMGGNSVTPVVTSADGAGLENGGSHNDGSKWSLSSDEQFLRARLALKKKYQNSDAMTQEEYNAKLLQLEINALSARLAANEESGAERVALQEQLADKLIQQKERQKKQEEKDAKDAERKANEATKAKEDEARKQEKINQDIAEMSGDRIAIEKAKYDKLKREYAGNARALEALEKAHKARLAKIQLEESDKEVAARRDAYEIARIQMLNRHRQEMETFSGSERQRREKRKEHWAELNALDEKYLNEMIATLTNLVDNAQVGDIQIGVELSDADKAKLLKQIEDLRQQLDKLQGTSEETQNDKNFFAEFLGISGERWEEILKEGFNIEDIITMTESLADSVMSIWGKVNDFLAQSESKQLKEYEKNNDKKKKSLEKRLNAGLMTEAQYNSEVAAMDAEYEAYQEELALKQAKRQKAMSITESIINTALGVTKSLTGMPWPINLIAAAATLAMGVAQTALIASQPITTGAEDGGPIGVRRAQDGKPFQARLNPDKRGFVSSPTVLVAENGLEYVIPNEVMQNHTALPFISAMESARRAGTLRNLDFSAIYPMRYAVGRAQGGYISQGDLSSIANHSGYNSSDDPELRDLLLRVLTRLNKPLDARVVMLGKNGLVEKMDEYNRYKKRGQIGG